MARWNSSAIAIPNSPNALRSRTPQISSAPPAQPASTRPVVPQALLPAARSEDASAIDCKFTIAVMLAQVVGHDDSRRADGALHQSRC